MGVGPPDIHRLSAEYELPTPPAWPALTWRWSHGQRSIGEYDVSPPLTSGQAAAVRAAAVEGYSAWESLLSGTYPTHWSWLQAAASDVGSRCSRSGAAILSLWQQIDALT